MMPIRKKSITFAARKGARGVIGSRDRLRIYCLNDVGVRVPSCAQNRKAYPIIGCRLISFAGACYGILFKPILGYSLEKGCRSGGYSLEKV